MPLTADPNDLIPYVLETDRVGPEPRPTFRLRALSELDLRQIRRLVQEAKDAGDDEDACVVALNKAIAISLRGYSGPPCNGAAVTPERPANDYLAAEELWELAFAAMTEPMLDAQKKRASAFSARSAKESSAKPAAAEGVTTVQLPENPPSSPA